MEATLGLTRPVAFGPGWPQYVPLKSPGAGEPATYTVPGKKTERLVSARGLLTCGSQAGIRLPRLQFKTADGLVFGDFTAGTPAQWLPEMVKINKPAKGATMTYTVPANRQQRILTAFATFVASAQEASRTPVMVIRTAAGETLFVATAPGEVVKSTTLSASYGLELGTAVTHPKGNAQVPLPDLILTGGDKVIFEAGSIQTEDQYESGLLVVETLPSGATQNFTYAAGLGYSLASADGTSQAGIPDMLLASGTEIVFDAVNLQTEDQLSEIMLMLERWPNGPDGYPVGVIGPNLDVVVV